LKAILALIALALCAQYIVAAQIQVSGEFGESWLESNQRDPQAANSTNDLWSWGGTPLGYEVSGNRLYPLPSSAEWYYPLFPGNSTPIVINATAPITLREDLLRDSFTLESLFYDPWTLAQVTSRPVYIRYPAIPEGSSTLS